MYGPDTRVIVRLEECIAEPEDDHYAVTEFHLGPAALLERLTVRYFGFT